MLIDKLYRSSLVECWLIALLILTLWSPNWLISPWPYIPGWPWIYRNLPASVSSVLGVKVCATSPGFVWFLKISFPLLLKLKCPCISRLTFCDYMGPLKTLLPLSVTFFSLWLFPSLLELNKSRKLFLSWIMPLALYLRIIVIYRQSTFSPAVFQKFYSLAIWSIICWELIFIRN